MHGSGRSCIGARRWPRSGLEGRGSSVAGISQNEDSGRRLAGDYAVQTSTDDYAANSVQAAPQWAFSFKEDGSFRSERQSRGEDIGAMAEPPAEAALEA